MKKYLAATIMLIVFLAVFIPLASSDPDGLEKVAASLGIQEPEPVWHGLMAGYSVNALGDSYVSTLMSGVLGTVFVLAAALVLGTAITKRRQTGTEK
jgi:ABC-type Fe3+ transport system permease subunit